MKERGRKADGRQIVRDGRNEGLRNSVAVFDRLYRIDMIIQD